MLFYFSGTGNSKYIAEYIAEITGDEIISINDYTKQNLFGQFSSEKPFIFVSPVYVSAPPIVVMDFVKNSQFIGNKKAYFISTCAGGMGATPYYWKKICQEKKLDYMGCEAIIMPQNYLVFFKTKDKEESQKIIDASTKCIPSIVNAILKEKAISLNEPTKPEIISTEMILKPYYDLFIKDDKFTVNEKCVHCKKCATVCPLNNIVIENGFPIWMHNCTHCMACINLCPKEAIEYGKQTIGKPRYQAPIYKK